MPLRISNSSDARIRLGSVYLPLWRSIHTLAWTVIAFDFLGDKSVFLYLFHDDILGWNGVTHFEAAVTFLWFIAFLHEFVSPFLTILLDPFLISDHPSHKRSEDMSFIFFILFIAFLKVFLRSVVKISRYLLPGLYGWVEFPCRPHIFLVLPLQIILDILLFFLFVIE